MANYTRLAALMGTHQELALFRRFTNLNAKNLLYMQSELIHLEAQLDIIELENERSGDAEKAALLVSVYDLKESAGTRNDMQWQKAQEIREKLRCYSLFTFQSANLKRLMGTFLDFRRSTPPTGQGISLGKTSQKAYESLEGMARSARGRRLLPTRARG